MDDHQNALIRELDGYLLFLKRRCACSRRRFGNSEVYSLSFVNRQEIELDYVESLRKVSTRYTESRERCEVELTVVLISSSRIDQLNNQIQKQSQSFSVSLLRARGAKPYAVEDRLHAQIPTSWRQSWFEVRCSLEDEAQSHRMAADGLDKLIQKLTHFRDDRVSTHILPLSDCAKES